MHPCRRQRCTTVTPLRVHGPIGPCIRSSLKTASCWHVCVCVLCGGHYSADALISPLHDSCTDHHATQRMVTNMYPLPRLLASNAPPPLHFTLSSGLYSSDSDDSDDDDSEEDSGSDDGTAAQVRATLCTALSPLVSLVSLPICLPPPSLPPSLSLCSKATAASGRFALRETFPYTLNPRRKRTAAAGGVGGVAGLDQSGAGEGGGAVAGGVGGMGGAAAMSQSGGGVGGGSSGGRWRSYRLG